MKTHHTPEPWTIDPEGEIASTIEGGDGRPLCDVYHPNTRTGEANARLIASAPELLKALIEMVECHKLNPKVWERAEAAIKQATQEQS